MSFLETHPHQFVDEGGKCMVDTAGWTPASSFYRFVASILGSRAVSRACVGLTQDGGMDTA
eukprot:5515041-Alexandrium_andersonii.AAC.1